MAERMARGEEAVTIEANEDRSEMPQHSMRFVGPESTILLISGTSKSNGRQHAVPDDFGGQAWQTLHNLSALLESEGASWDNVVRTTSHLRDLERDYRHFNEIRTRFCEEIGLGLCPPNVGIQGRIQPQDLLLEIEAIAILPHRDAS